MTEKTNAAPQPSTEKLRTGGHAWVPPNDVVRWEHCAICGIIRSRKDDNNPCKGAAKIALREYYTEGQGEVAAAAPASAGYRAGMIKIDQTEFGESRGNCQSACTAMMLGLPLSVVPNFYDVDEAKDAAGIERWNAALDAFLHQHNACRVTFRVFDGWRTALKGYYLMVGKSPRGDFKHCVIYKDGALWHDPHPSRDGVEVEEEIEIYYAIDPSLRTIPAQPADDAGAAQMAMTNDLLNRAERYCRQLAPHAANREGGQLMMELTAALRHAHINKWMNEDLKARGM